MAKEGRKVLGELKIQFTISRETYDEYNDEFLEKLCDEIDYGVSNFIQTLLPDLILSGSVEMPKGVELEFAD